MAWKNSGTGMYTAWIVDADGNHVSTPTGEVAGTSLALKQLENSFHQDLNGDGRIGVVTTVIDSAGSTSLTQLDDIFYFYDSSGNRPVLKSGGAAVVAGQFGAMSPIGAEQTATGYQVAWKNSGNGLYTIWNTDSDGAWLATPLYEAAGTSLALKQLEPGFHQDLNGDGRIGVVTTVIETAGATRLTRIDDNFYFYNSDGNGPSLKTSGPDYDAAQDYESYLNDSETINALMAANTVFVAGRETKCAA